MRAFWLIPVLPLGVFVVLAMGVARWSGAAAALSVVAVSGAAALSAVALASIAGGGGGAVISVPWLDAGGRPLTLALQLDPVGAVAAMLVAVVGVAVVVYAVGYMPHDRRRGRFFGLMSLFIGSMLTLVLAGDLVTLFIAWELVGVCSYLLIGFWFEHKGVGAAATKAFTITRLGDAAMLLGVLAFVGAAGTGRMDAVIDVDRAGLVVPASIAALLVVAGAAAKSAQVPFQGWLPDAMVGPAPVSALLHSATMVAAGAFLIARLYPVLAAVPPALAVVSWIGITTALLGGLAALVEPDLKRTLAYSTMSHVGLMFVALGAGSVAAAVFLLVGHAFYKALLFLAAGAIDHQAGTTDLGRLGGVRDRMPRTAVAFVLGAAAMAGLPVTLALPPEEGMLAAVWASNPTQFALALVATTLSALYSTRLVALVVLEPPASGAPRATEAGPAILVPLLAFATATPLALLANAELLGRPLDRLLGVRTPEAPVVTILALASATLGVTLGLAATRRWRRAVVWPPLGAVAPLLRRELGLEPGYRSAASVVFTIAAAAAAMDRWIFDAAAGRITTHVRAVASVAARIDRDVFDAAAGVIASRVGAVVNIAARIDRDVFDAVATKAGRATAAAIAAAGRFDIRRFDRGVRSLSAVVLAAGQRTRALQTGRIENYLLAAFAWALIVLGLAAFAASRG